VTQRTGGGFVVDGFERAGIRHVFGVPGESYMGVLDALHDSSVQFISARHEGGASFMASAYSKVSGEIGVCMGTRAVGTANFTIGVHNARQDSTPMIAIAGQVQREFLHREAFQEIDLVAAMTPICKWAVQAPSAERMPELMARAIQVATSGRPGPVFLGLPQDVCDELAEGEAPAVVPVTRPSPDPAAVDTIVQAIRAASAPVLFAGGGACRDRAGVEALVRAAEALEVPVVTSWRHHDGFPNDHPLFLGSASLGTAPVVWQRLRDADVVVVVGNRLQENSTQGYTLPTPAARVFVVDIVAETAPPHVVPELVVTSDAVTFLDALSEVGRASVVSDDRRRRNAADRQAFEAATELPPRRTGAGVAYRSVVHALRAALPRAGIVTTDGGNFAGWLSRYYRYLEPQTYVGPTSGSMGYGLPAAIAAKLARPDVPVVGVSGDGGFMMTIGELETAVRYGIDIVAVVMDNQRHGTIRMHQEREHPGRTIGTELGTPDLAAVAKAFGATGWTVTDDSQLAPALHEALATPGPALLHLQMDRDQLSVDTRLP
jgi:acetolactate synthase-1/2/3 large subunit